MGSSQQTGQRPYTMIKAFVMILFVGIITGAPRGPDTPKELKEGGAEHFKLKEGEADMAGIFKSCIDSGKLLQCTKSAKKVCPVDKLKVEVEEEEEENDSDEKVKTCIDSGKLLKCIQSVRIVCPKSF